MLLLYVLLFLVRCLCNVDVLTQGKTNFFEKRVGEYQKANVAASGSSTQQRSFDIDADF